MRERAERSHRGAVERGAVRLGRVLVDLQAVLVGDRDAARHLGRVAVEVDRHDALGLVGDGGLDRGRVEAEVVRLDVGEHRRGTGQRDGVGGRGEGERGHDDLVARPDPEASRPRCSAGGAGVDGYAGAAVDEGPRRTPPRTPRPAGPGRACRCQDAVDGRALLVADDRLGCGDQVVSCVSPGLLSGSLSRLDVLGPGRAGRPSCRPSCSQGRRPCRPSRSAGPEPPPRGRSRGTSLVTTEPAATSRPAADCHGGHAHGAGADRGTVARCHADRLPVVAVFSEPSGLTARGKWSLVNTTAGPMNTPLPSRRARRPGRSSASCSCRPSARRCRRRHRALRCSSRRGLRPHGPGRGARSTCRHRDGLIRNISARSNVVV